MNIGFSNLKVRNYRRLVEVDLQLAPLNVLIGANGVGKTSILEVLDLLAASADGRLQETLSEAGGLSSVVSHPTTQSAENDRDLTVGVEMPVAAPQPIIYELNLRPTALGYTITTERLSQRQKIDIPEPFKFIDSRGADIRYFDIERKELVRPTWQHQPLETSLAQVPKMFQEPERFRQVLASSTLYHVLDVSSRAPVRLPQPMQPAALPGRDGEDLISCLYYLRESDRDRFEAVIDAARVAFPTLERLDFPPAAAGSLTMAWKDRHYTKPLYPHQLSEGTLRFLWLATLLQSPQLPTITMIDEPEVSLHPQMLRLLAELMREASARTQLIVATHSDRFVRFLNSSELVVMDLDEEGRATVTRASELDLAAWLEDYSLDQLWSMGRLGGRP